MMRSNRILVAAALACLILPAVARSAEPDLSNPKAAARSFFDAMSRGDVAAVEKTVVFSPDPAKREEEKEIMSAMTAMVAGMNKLADAATAKFGEAGKEIVAENPTEGALKRLEDAQEKIDGDKATLAIRNQAEPTQLKKMEGQWKIDLAAMPQRDTAAGAVPFLRGMAKAAVQTADEITQGKYADVAQAKTALGDRMRLVIEGGEGPTTEPATRTTGPSKTE